MLHLHANSFKSVSKQIPSFWHGFVVHDADAADASTDVDGCVDCSVVCSVTAVCGSVEVGSKVKYDVAGVEVEGNVDLGVGINVASIVVAGSDVGTGVGVGTGINVAAMVVAGSVVGIGVVAVGA